MYRQAGIAWLLILLQAAMFWYMSETIVFPVLVLLISSPAVWWRRRWEVSPGYLPWIDLVLAAGCALRWNLAPYEPPTMISFLNYPLVHAAGQFFLLAQVARLWARRPDRPLPVYLPLLAVMVFICLGDVQLSKYGRMRRMHQRATFALVGLSCAYYAMSRKRQEPSSRTARWVRPVASGAVLVVCVVGASAGNRLVLEKWSALEQFIMRASGARPPQRQLSLMVGFSGQAPLGSVQLLRSSLDAEIAVRVFSDRPPGYLRGAVFERYTSHGWESQGDWTPMGRNRKPLPISEDTGSTDRASKPSGSVFQLRNDGSRKLRSIAIWRAPSMDRFTFLPLSTSRLETSVDVLNFDRHTVVAADNMPAEASLTAWVPESADVPPIEPIIQPISQDDETAWKLDRLQTLTAKYWLRSLPHRLAESPEILQVAKEVFADCKTPQDKVMAVKRHFATFQYGTSIQVPAMSDPVAYFLQDKPPAHCEFFASATAVLLRLASVPCRYVTGYAGGEYNTFGKYWVVRQRDAHAWVEAYLPDEGWVIVDTTPEDRGSTASSSFGLWQLWDEVTLRGQMIRTALAGEGWSGKWMALKLFVWSFLTTIPGAVISGGLLFLAVRKLKFARRPTVLSSVEPAMAELRRLLAELDRRLRQFKLERETHETLHQFAERLRAAAASSRPNLRDAAEWYLRYAAMRYGQLSFPPELQDQLRTELQTVCARLSERRKAL